eukprot:TRINITY_DN4126_c0_g1_i6.p3 TRINITY_DN4126_c0_g1~~TRINITY_DN4126_c0_g1_i6.p3  ORF type:complete len:187 (+),score=24.23 TRINITY_DN4126_c0_g1_i6:122-682(+)
MPRAAETAAETPADNGLRQLLEEAKNPRPAPVQQLQQSALPRFPRRSQLSSTRAAGGGQQSALPPFPHRAQLSCGARRGVALPREQQQSAPPPFPRRAQLFSSAEPSGAVWSAHSPQISIGGAGTGARRGAASPSAAPAPPAPARPAPGMACAARGATPPSGSTSEAVLALDNNQIRGPYCWATST